MKTSYIITYVLLITTLALSSCKVSKDVTPAVEVPAAYANAPEDTTQAGKLPWNTFFTDPTLKQLIDSALQHNSDLLVALMEIEAAEQLLKQAKTGNMPTLGLQVSAATSRPSDNSLSGFQLNTFLNANHIEDYTAATALAWEADVWGKIRQQKRAALAVYLRTDEARKAIQTRIISDVAKGYYNLLMLYTQLATARRNVALSDSTLAIIQLQYNIGQVSSLAVQQAEAQQLTAASLVPLFEKQIAIQQNALNRLTGRFPENIAIHTDLAATEISDNIGAGVPAGLLQNRPDVRLSALQLTEANANVGYAKASLYPSLVITAQGGINAFKASNWFSLPASLFGTVAGGITQPLLQHRRYKTQYKVAQIKRDEKVIQFRQAVLVAVEEVSDNLITIAKLREQREYANRRVEKLHKATANAHLLFNGGLADYLEVITAQDRALQSDLELASLKKAALDAHVDLYRALGGGWTSAK